MNPTIKDVAKEAGVSVGTASMAMSGRGSVSAATREKVRAAASRLGYHPNQFARLLNSKRTMTVGLVVTDIVNPFFGSLVQYIHETLMQRGYDMILDISNSSLARERTIVRRFLSLKVDGIIVVPSHKQASDVSHLQDLCDRQVPLCFVTAFYNDIAAPCVMTDLAEGAFQLTNYLLDMGHRAIYCIMANPAISSSDLRLEGVRGAYRKRGLAFPDDHVVVSAPEHQGSFEGGYRSAQTILQAGRPDAVITINDFVAIGALRCLQENGLQVPEDVSVAGYDDVMYSSLLEPPLTTVRQPLNQMSAKAVDLLLERMENPAKAVEKVLLRPQLVVRGSTAPVKRMRE